ncbi:hypothetical protein Taro_029720, partial [Colocasia esculenta]|nr:hypothetical protein [Colocasia esculenta]
LLNLSVVHCVYRLWGSYPIEPVTCEAHPFFFQVKESRRVLVPLLVPVGIIVESGLHHQQSNAFTCGALRVCPELLYLLNDYDMKLISRTCVVDIPCEASARSREAESCRARY